MLTWKTTEAHVATYNGRTYTVCENPQHAEPFHRAKGAKPYMAIASFFDINNRLYQHVVGFFSTVTEAKAACDNDAKELISAFNLME